MLFPNRFKPIYTFNIKAARIISVNHVQENFSRRIFA